MFKTLTRNVSIRHMLDNLFVSAVATVLVIRAFLFLTGWPIIGGERLHIAHMLWGGFFMIAAIILLLAFLGHRIQHFSAILGGVGFGFFIDELGKFITRNNDYFFQPTFMLMYLIFVGLYFTIRQLEKSMQLNDTERLVNVLDLSQEAVLKQVDAEERRQLLQLIEAPSGHEKLFEQLRMIIAQATVTPETRWFKFKQRCKEMYFHFAESKYFVPSVIGLWLVQSGLLTFSFQRFLEMRNPNVAEQIIVVLGAGFAVIAATNILWGIFDLGTSRIEGYRKFYRGNLISVLLMQPFALYVATFGPIIALGINLVVLFALQYLLALEKRRGPKREESPAL